MYIYKFLIINFEFGQDNVIHLDSRNLLIIHKTYIKTHFFHFFSGEKQRLGAAIAAYLEYLDICASNYPGKRSIHSSEDVRAQNTIARNWLDLDIFSMKKFLEDVIGPLRVPSHKRYLHYFSGLLSGKIKMNSSPLYLRYVAIESPPSWLNYDGGNNQHHQAEWRSFIKVYEGLNCVFTSGICSTVIFDKFTKYR